MNFFEKAAVRISLNIGAAILYPPKKDLDKFQLNEQQLEEVLDHKVTIVIHPTGVAYNEAMLPESLYQSLRNS